ncbi:MAG: hypothetical protein JW909_09785 [Planctomycetes bacterium]|nr:hypothetical protein [Planctomycetota bacterium]
MKRFLTVLAILGAAAGCSTRTTDVAWENVQHTRPRKVFGYLHTGVGVGGLPGRDDIKPGTTVTVYVPPRGVFVTAFAVGAVLAVAALSDGDCNLDLNLNFERRSPDVLPEAADREPETGDRVPYAPYGEWRHEKLPPAQPWWPQATAFEESGPFKITGMGMDAMFSWTSAEDLTAGGDVRTASGGLGARFMGGLNSGTRWHALVGLEITGINFENRPFALNWGPYVGFGLEVLPARNAGLSATVRYSLLTGDEPDYNHWEFTGGFIFYW